MGSSYINHFIQPDTIIPDPSNPQGLNRYSYVENRPVNFNDPTGHQKEKELTGFQRERQNRLRQEDEARKIKDKYVELFKLTEKGTIDDLEALAQLVEFAAQLTPKCTSCFVANLGRVLTGYFPFSGTHVMLERIPQTAGWFPKYNVYLELNSEDIRLGQKGYAQIFKDPGPGGQGNQARHFWQYVQSSYFEGTTLALGGNAFHETLDPWEKTTGKSYQDFALGVEGAFLGKKLRSGTVTPVETGQYIRNHLSPGSSSASYWANPLDPFQTNQYIPGYLK